MSINTLECYRYTKLLGPIHSSRMCSSPSYYRVVRQILITFTESTMYFNKMYTHLAEKKVCIQYFKQVQYLVCGDAVVCHVDTDWESSQHSSTLSTLVIRHVSQ
jgi:hypothetical protein